MSAFRFSLEQVLRYRKQLEEQAMLVFAQAVQVRDNRLRDKEECERAIGEAHARLAGAAALDADERWLVSVYLTALKHDHKQIVADLAVLEEDVDKSRTELTQKAQERKLLEKLKEKQSDRHKVAENQREQQNYDDIATIRFTPPSF